MHKRLFIAIRINPTEEFLRRVYFLKNNLDADLINWIREDHYHLTLQFIGNTSTRLIPAIIKNLKLKIDELKSYELMIKGVGIFGSQYNPKVIWFGVEPFSKLTQLHQEIQSSLEKIVVLKNGQNFVPHLSIARIKKIEDKNHFQKVIAMANQDLIQVQDLKEIILFESILNTKGAEYDVVDCFSLI